MTVRAVLFGMASTVLVIVGGLALTVAIGWVAFNVNDLPWPG